MQVLGFDEDNLAGASDLVRIIMPVLGFGEDNHSGAWIWIGPSCRCFDLVSIML